MKRRLIAGLVVCLALMAGLFVCAGAADDPLKVSMELSVSKFTGPKEITVSIKVSNAGEGDMPGPVTLYYPNGKQVEDFGSPTLSVGSSQSWSGSWKVTQAQLDKGKITFKIKYSVYNDDGELVNKTKNFSKAITYTGTVANVEINRTISPTTAKKGQEVSVTYDVVNAGNVDITDVSIKENSAVSSKKGTIDKVAAGEKGTYTFTFKMGSKDVTSQATITYTVDGKTHTTKKEAATVKYGEVKLTGTLSADKKGGVPGDTVKLSLKLKNSGTADFTNVKVTDATLGDVFTGETVAAGKTVTLEKDVSISATADYQFTITAQDPDGNDVETSTGRVTVTAMDPAQKIALTLNAVADREVVYTLPGTVRFKVTVTNESAVDVKDVTVSAAGVKLYTFPSVLAGESRDFTRDVSVSMAGQYQFEASCKDQLQETVTFDSNIVPIGFEQPTAVPTEAPIVTPPMPVHEDIPTDDGLPAYVDTVQGTLGSLKWVFMVLAVACALLLVAGLARRQQAKRESDKAMDHLERGSYRDYSQPAPEKKERPTKREEPVERAIGEDKEEPDLPDTPDEEIAAAESGDIMAETLRKLYPRTGQSLTTDPSKAEEIPLTDEQSAYTAGSDGSYQLASGEGEESDAADESADDTGDEPEIEEAPAEEPVQEPLAENAEASETDASAADGEFAPAPQNYRRHRRSQRHEN